MTEEYFFKQRNKIKLQKEELNEGEIINLPNKKFKVMVIKMLTELGKRMGKHG